VPSQNSNQTREAVGQLFTRDCHGRLFLKKVSEHGLGHLLNPLDPDAEPVKGENDDAPQWIKTIWEVMIRRELGEAPSLPEWILRPALSRVSATRPEIIRRLNEAKRRLPYAKQIKPANFLLAAHVKPMGHPVGVDPEHFQLIAPYDPDPRRWLNLVWRNRYTGTAHPISTRDSGDSRVAHVKSYLDVLDEYATHPEPKSVDSARQPCDRQTRGLLYRRHVQVGSIYYVNKESNFLEDVEFGLIHDSEEVQQRYFDPIDDRWQALRSTLKQVPSKEVARRTGLTRRYVRALRNGHKSPTGHTASTLLRMLDGWFREQTRTSR
jgi:hypothetical protein